MALKRRVKINKKLILAFGLAVGSLILIYKVGVPQDKINVKYVQYVRAARMIEVDQKITEEMLTYDTMPSDKVTSSVITRKEDIINSYAKSNIYPGEAMRKERIKYETESEYGTEEREVRIYTDLQAFGGVGPGDRADLIFVGDGKGIIKYEGVLVKKVLNNVGQDIATVADNKFNVTEATPYIVICQVSQSMGLEIETLMQNKKEVAFKFFKWTEKSNRQNTENQIKEYNNLINKRLEGPEGNINQAN